MKKAEELLWIKRNREIPWKNNETDLSNLPDPEFKREVIKMLKELRKSIEMQITVTRN